MHITYQGKLIELPDTLPDSEGDSGWVRFRIAKDYEGITYGHYDRDGNLLPITYVIDSRPHYLWYGYVVGNRIGDYEALRKAWQECLKTIAHSQSPSVVQELSS
jgi:hypothetical protein